MLARLDTLRTQAQALNCDLVAKGRVGLFARGWLYLGGDQWKSDYSSVAPITTAQLLALAAAATS
jgi:hypothetical protein